MSKPKSKNSLLASHNRAVHSSTAKDEILAMKYTMTEPSIPIFPLDDKLPSKTYPDYNPWKDDEAQNSKLNDSNCLNKGFFEGPLVSNEYFSARNLIQDTLFSSSKNCTTILKELSLNLTKAYKTRNDVINKIRYNSNNFKVPPRVTLTALKREAWLKDLANPEVPLQQVSTKLPHGLRNKVLVDSMCNMNVPITRAVWFTKCALYSDLILLERKFQAKQNVLAPTSVSAIPSLAAFKARWLQEWTLHVADYVLKFSREMMVVTSEEKKVAYQSKLNYLLCFVQTLYIECLMDKSTFLSSIINFLKDDLPFLPSHLPSLLELSRTEFDEENVVCEELLRRKPINFGQILVALTLIKIFWRDILPEDYLCKALSESLLLNYFLIQRLSMDSQAGSRPRPQSNVPSMLKRDILSLISTSVVDLFKHNTNSFIVPTYWELIGEVLFGILTNDSGLSSAKDKKELLVVLQLINYRNESLMLNMKYFASEEQTRLLSIKPLGKVSVDGSNNLLGNASSGNDSNQYHDSDNALNSRSSDDNLRFIDQLDKLKLNNFMTTLLAPKPSDNLDSNTWRTKLKIVVYWCVSAFRDMGTSSEKILIICNFMKKKVLQALASKGSSQLRAEFENDILESIFSLAQEPSERISMYDLHVLINELYQLKIISISSYLRKVIACGIFYKSSAVDENYTTTVQKDPQIEFHLLILQNLPVLNNKQCDHILRKWTSDVFSFSDLFNRGIEIIQHHFLDDFLNNHVSDNFDTHLEEIKLMNVGVKFLLVNWLTSQIKTMISQSPKLIHISPPVIANIYQFYACTDNLTVFFKVFVKFVLKNENKVIIYYLDTLYFISKLIVHHYTLVKFIAGNSYESVSTAYELFKLVVLSYKDLLTRETDVYHFKAIWRFIDLSMDKSYSGNTFGPGDGKRGLDKLLFGKETADSPLSLLSQAMRQNDSYSTDAFKNDLNRLLSAEMSIFSSDEFSDANEKMKSISISFDLDSMIDELQIHLLLSSILSNWFVNMSILSEEQEAILSSFMEICRRRSRNKDYMSGVISAFISRWLEQNTDDPNELITFLMKLLSYEVVLLAELLVNLDEIKGKSQDQRLITILFALVYDADLMSRSRYGDQRLLLEIARSDYINDHVEEIYIYTLEQFHEVADITADPLFQKYSAGIRRLVWQVLLQNKTLAISVMSSKLSKESVLAVCYPLVGLSTADAEGTDIVRLAAATNEFSLPVIQAILRALSCGETPMLEKLNGEILKVLEKLQFLFGPYNSFFGEMFNYLSWDYKVALFKYLETFFLTQIQFEQVWDLHDAMVTEDVHYVSLKSNSEGLELMPIFKDFFKKFSVLSVERIPTSMDLFNNLFTFLIKLLHLLENDSVVHLGDRNVYDMVSIFLRLIIIHNASLTNMIANNDSGHFLFLKNLVALLNSRYLSNGHEKLQILLYDLLLLMKSSLTQILAANPEDLIPPSPSNPSQLEEKSSTNLPETFEHRPSSVLANMTSILNLLEPSSRPPQFEHSFAAECALTLDEDELRYGSDISFVNDAGLTLTPNAESLSFSSPFNVPREKTSRPFAIQSMQLIEDTGTGVNDGCLNLSIFEAYTTKENPL